MTISPRRTGLRLIFAGPNRHTRTSPGHSIQHAQRLAEAGTVAPSLLTSRRHSQAFAGLDRKRLVAARHNRFPRRRYGLPRHFQWLAFVAWRAAWTHPPMLE